MGEHQVSEARKHLGRLWNDVVFGGGVERLLKNGANGEVLMIGDVALAEILAPFTFHPEINDNGASEVSIWLPELGVHGVGDTLDDAREDLLDTVRDYVDLYLADAAFRDAPNRAPQFRHVLRAHVADVAGTLADVVMGTAAAPALTLA